MKTRVSPRAGAIATAALSLSLLTLSPASAATFTFVTAPGATTSGGPVDASAVFTTGTNSISVVLTNLQPNITDVAQALSDLQFTYSGTNLAGQSLSSSSGQETTVAGNGTFTTGGTVAAGWVLSSPAPNTLLLNDLGAGGAGPAHLIIGPPGAGGTYSNANGSIAGNGPHNPFLDQSATFSIFLPGISSTTSITSAIFSFGTVAGINVPGVLSQTGGQGEVPLPAALPLFASGAGVLGLLNWRRKKKSAALAA